MVKHADREFAREIRIRACKFLGISPHHDGGYDERTFDKRKDPETVSFENSRLKMQLLDKKQLESFQAMFEKRRRLPAMRKGIDLLEAIRNHQVLLVVGSKGCGKTTQIPQMLLDEYIYNNRASECRIICLQTSSYKCEDVAERVAYERVERLGKSAIGFENKKRAIAPRDFGSILFCTAGNLMHKFVNNPFLINISAVILDDVHEETYEYSEMMTLLAIILPFRPDLKIILLSALTLKHKLDGYFKHIYTFDIDKLLSSSHFEQIREKRKSIWDRLSGYQSEERSLDTDRYFSKQKNDKYIDGSFEYAAPKATNGKCEDLDIKTKEAEDEYRCSIAFLWMYADSDLSSISEWDRALIQNNRKQIKSFEKKYPHLAAEETKILLEKTKLSSRNETMKEDQHTEKAKRNENDAYGNDTVVAAVKRTGGLSVDVIHSSKKQKTMSSEDLNVAIVDWSDLDGNIMPANWLLLEERLLNEMVSEKWCNDIISFDGAEWSRGVKLVKCGNEKSLEFLKTTIAKVGEMWPRAQLAVIPESRLPLRTFVNMWIPPPVPETRHVFELLGKQNEGFVIDDWQIISTTPCHNNNGITFRLAVDAKSLKKLKECHGHVRFGFGFIRIQTE